MNIAITGGTGYIGSNLAKKLSLKHKVTLLVRNQGLKTIKSNHGKNIKIISTDFSDISSIKLSLRGVHAVYHLAGALPNLPMSEEEYFDTNAYLAKRVYIAATKVHSIKQFVLCSTAYVTWIDDKPSDEKSKSSPGTIYEKSKLLGEELIINEETKHKLPLTIIRPGYVYGNQGLGLLSLCKAIKSHKFFYVGDGKNKFELTHIKDLIRIFERILAKKTAYGQTFVVSTTSPMSFEKIVRIIANALEEPLPKIHIPRVFFKVIVYPVIKIVSFLKIPFPISIETYKTLTLSRSFKTNKIKKILNFNDQVDHRQEIIKLVSWYIKRHLV